MSEAPTLWARNTVHTKLFLLTQFQQLLLFVRNTKFKLDGILTVNKDCEVIIYNASLSIISNVNIYIIDIVNKINV